jgi:hypothetical protein
MKKTACCIFLAISILGSGACTKADEARARDKAKKAGEEIKRDARQAGEELKKGLHKANKELNHELGEPGRKR